MAGSIADVVLEALRGLKRLLAIIGESDDISIRTSLFPRLDDELARFKVWAGNSGAHRTGRASLEHRLRDASHIRHQVLRLLCDLKDSLEDAADIMTGKSTPWEETKDDEEVLDDLEIKTEMDQIVLDVTELVDCLLRLSVSIQNPAPHDRFMDSNFTDTSAYEDFDIGHVQAKFQDIDEGLAQRLGKAMSRRRQYFKYREAHHQKLSHGLDRHGDTNKTEPTLPAPSTLASSIPLQMKQEVPIDISGDDIQSDGRASATSFATSISGPRTLKVPPMPENALRGPFTCPFCYLIISVQDTRAWKKHVFGDLRPYNCLAPHCTAPDREFSRRNEWMQHMLQDHLRAYRCPFGCPEHFSSAAESRGHLSRAHSGAIAESKVDSIVELSSQPLARDAHTECPFCPEQLTSLKQYRRHVGNHQQDLALFALPPIEEGDGDGEGGHSVGGHESDDISLSAHGEEPIDATDRDEEADINTEDVHEPRFPRHLDHRSLASKNSSVSPVLSPYSSSLGEARRDQLPDNLDQDLPPFRSATCSPPRTVSSSYDEPFSAELSEDEMSTINPEQSSNAVSSTYERQSSNLGQWKQFLRENFTGVLKDKLVDVAAGFTGETPGDSSDAFGINTSDSNMSRKSAPRDGTDNISDVIFHDIPPVDEQTLIQLISEGKHRLLSEMSRKLAETSDTTAEAEQNLRELRKTSRELQRILAESLSPSAREYLNTKGFTEELSPDSWEADQSIKADSGKLQRRRPMPYGDNDVFRSTEQPNETETTNDQAPSINHKESHPPPDVTTTTHDRERENQLHTNEAPTSPKGTKRRSKKERKLISKLGFETVECPVPGCEFETDFPNRNDFERHFRAWHPQNEDLVTILDALTCPNAYCKGMVAYTSESQFRGHMLRVHVIDVKPGGKSSVGKAGASDDNKTAKTRR